ncbi:DUF4249 domain-containing protein [Algivirga pacifica]|uniref:DUF4249 domain-containing protein n=1 Tax=Algivirga pacifica TaxID=1162670 RepID=A0ABP9CZR7_9BACT
MKFIVIAFLLFFTSCITTLLFEEDAYVPTPVVGCLFHPDSTWKLHLSLSEPLSNSTRRIVDIDSSYWITDAEVNIFENGEFYTQLEYSEKGYYRSPKKPSPGKTYRLKIETKDFGTIEAEDQVPLPPDMEYHGKTKITDEYGNEVDAYHVEIIDPKGQENHYFILFETFSTGISVVDSSEYSYYENYYTNLLEEDILDTFELDYRLYISDKGMDGETLSLHFSGGNFAVSRADQKYFYVGSASSHYINYHKALAELRKDMIYVAEKPRMYTNIQGGGGIFAAYNFNN